jgi:hypothetical protein
MTLATCRREALACFQGPGLDGIERHPILIDRRSNKLSPLPSGRSLWGPSGYQKKKPVPTPKRKAGTRAVLTKAGIAAAAAKLIESVGPGEFSVRELAKAMGVGPTSIHAHFKGGTGAVLDAVAAQAVAGTTRPFKPIEEPTEYFRDLLLGIL